MIRWLAPKSSFDIVSVYIDTQRRTQKYNSFESWFDSTSHPTFIRFSHIRNTHSSSQTVKLKSIYISFFFSSFRSITGNESVTTTKKKRGMSKKELTS